MAKGDGKWTAIAGLPVSPTYLCDTALEPERELIPQWKPTPESETWCFAQTSMGDRPGLPPRLARSRARLWS